MIQTARSRILWIGVFWAIAGCQGPSIADGALACGDNGTCPEGFECAANSRCYHYAGVCGDTVLDPGETCDPDGVCPTSCSDGNACTVDDFVGSPASCNVKCERRNLTACVHDDKCCPAECSPASDNDCLASCKNGARDPGETCDDSAAGFACIVNCDDGNACTVDSEMGSAANCNLDCQSVQITDCLNDDGCCAPGCTSDRDNDCPADCGNGAKDLGETCDDSSANPNHACPTPASCSDGAACTFDQFVGAAGQCTAACLPPVPITDCVSGDMCCPSGCTAVEDSDCISTTCPNGQIDGDETCDPQSNKPPEQCPTDADCDDNNPCTVDRAVAQSDQCHVICVHSPITDCKADGCCDLSQCTGSGGPKLPVYGAVAPSGDSYATSAGDIDPDCGDATYDGSL